MANLDNYSNKILNLYLIRMIVEQFLLCCKLITEIFLVVNCGPGTPNLRLLQIANQVLFYFFRPIKLKPKKPLERSSFKNGRGPQFIFDPMSFRKPHTEYSHQNVRIK